MIGTNQWDPLPDMNEIRSDFSAVTYGSRVFAIGGFNGTDVLGGVEQYNSEESVWTPYTSLVTPRSGTRCISALVTTITTCAHIAWCRSIVYEDKVYILGGYDGTSRLRSVECFTPGLPGSRPTWHQVTSSAMGESFQREAQVADMLEPRSNFSVAIIDNRLIVMGGYRLIPNS